MKVLFVHNIRMKKDTSGKLYTHSSYSQDVWNRYLKIGTDLSIISRKDLNIYSEEYAKSHFEEFDSHSINNIKVSDITNSILSFLNLCERKKNDEIIEKAIISHDYIIARLPSPLGYKAIKYAKKHNKKYLVEVVACTWDSLWNHSMKGKILAPIDFLKLKKYVKNSSYVVYVTNKFLQKRYPTIGKSVNCSNVALTEFNEKILNERINNIKQRSNKIILGTTGAINVRFKGQKYVIEALGKLKKQGITNLEYQVVGDGDQKYLKSIATKYNVVGQVKFLGAIPHDEVFKWLDTIDIYVQPSRQEGLPRGLIEAMSRGLPAFGARTGGIPELLEEKFIFSNTRKNIDEICSILLSMSNEVMYQQSIRNYKESMKYSKDVIEKRRDEFFSEFTNKSLN